MEAADNQKKDRPDQLAGHRTALNTEEIGNHKVSTPDVSSPRPYWQAEPCPPWCLGGHLNEHSSDDRKHFSEWTQPVQLTLHDPVIHRGDGEILAEPVELLVHVIQHNRETAPRVVVEPEIKTEGLDTLHLTEAEALRLSEALAAGVRLARGEPGQDDAPMVELLEKKLERIHRDAKAINGDLAEINSSLKASS